MADMLVRLPPATCIRSGGLCVPSCLNAPSADKEALRKFPTREKACRPCKYAAWKLEQLESAGGWRALRIALAPRKDPSNVQRQRTFRSRAANDEAVCSCRGTPEVQQLPSSSVPNCPFWLLVEARADKNNASSSCCLFRNLLQIVWRIRVAVESWWSSRQAEGDWRRQCDPTSSSRNSSSFQGVVAGLVLVCLLSTEDVSVQAAAAEVSSSSSPAVQTERGLAQEAVESGEGQQEVGLSKPSNCNAAVAEEEDESGAEAVTSESLVEEAWGVVDEFFFDARHNSWTREGWLRTKEEILRRPVRSRMAAYGIIRSMLASLDDPYTRFLTPDQFSQLTKYDVTGIGINVGEVPGEGGGAPSLKVLGIVLGSPAQAAGVRQGDELLSVNGTWVVGKSAFEASSLIQGPKGTSVSLQIRHGPCSEPLQVMVSRQQAVRTPVFYRLQRSKETGELMGYIQLREFNALARRDLVTAMLRLEAGGATSLVLDLQDNPGGLVQAGIEVAKLFLETGETVVDTVGRDPASQRSIAASGVPLTRVPLLVLVNDRTASASEIVSAALHDNCRALLVGRRTFGKGLIQSIYELSDGSGVILTVGKYVTPGHSDIDGRGIEPDFNRIPSLDQARRQLSRCLQMKQSS